jgi:hypothetical protein
MLQPLRLGHAEDKQSTKVRQDARLPVGDVVDLPPTTPNNAVEHDVVSEPIADRGDDLGEVSGEWAVLAGVQPHTPPVCGGDQPVS